MDIKTIECLSLHECKEYISQNPNGEHIFEVTRRLEDLSRDNKSKSEVSPNFILWDEFCSKYPIYACTNKFNWKIYKKILLTSLSIFAGLLIVLVISHLLVGWPDHIDDLDKISGIGVIILILVFLFGAAFCAPVVRNVFDVENTDSEYKIVRAPVLTMGVFKFTNNRIYYKIPIYYSKVVHIGDGTYLLENDDKKGLLNILSNGVWLHPMDTCEISWENNIISISKEGQIIKKISTRGFKYEN